MKKLIIISISFLAMGCSHKVEDALRKEIRELRRVNNISFDYNMDLFEKANLYRDTVSDLKHAIDVLWDAYEIHKVSITECWEEQRKLIKQSK